jgi:hypothetical protein
MDAGWLPVAPIIRPQPAGSRRGFAGKKAGQRVDKADGSAMSTPTRPAGKHKVAMV